MGKTYSELEFTELCKERDKLAASYRYWQCKSTSIVGKAVCDLLEDAVEVIEGVIKRARPTQSEVA